MQLWIDARAVVISLRHQPCPACEVVRRRSHPFFVWVFEKDEHAQKNTHQFWCVNNQEKKGNNISWISKADDSDERADLTVTKVPVQWQKIPGLWNRSRIMT